MLSKPEFGWTNFSLGEKAYSLSYITNVPLQWLEQAIHGMETMSPFCVRGFCEPGRMICTVSFWNCHIIMENEAREVLKREDTSLEIVHISMLDFCKKLHDSIDCHIDDWCRWDRATVLSKEVLQSRLDRLQEIIEEKTPLFAPDCFLI